MDVQKLLKLIQELEQRKTSSCGRTIRPDDINMEKTVYVDKVTKNKLTSFRKQGEFGAKKFIKP